MVDSKLVFSTDSGSHKRDVKESSWVRAEGPMKMRLETAGRGGKAVTVLFQIPLEEAAAKDLLKAMQAAFGCGGSVKDSTLELRGDVRSKVEDFLAKKCIKVKRAGG